MLLWGLVQNAYEFESDSIQLIQSTKCNSIEANQTLPTSFIMLILLSPIQFFLLFYFFTFNTFYFFPFICFSCLYD